jgi:hypothetical protein
MRAVHPVHTMHTFSGCTLPRAYEAAKGKQAFRVHGMHWPAPGLVATGFCDPSAPSRPRKPAASSGLTRPLFSRPRGESHSWSVQLQRAADTSAVVSRLYYFTSLRAGLGLPAHVPGAVQRSGEDRAAPQLFAADGKLSTLARSTQNARADHYSRTISRGYVPAPTAPLAGNHRGERQRDERRASP